MVRSVLALALLVSAGMASAQQAGAQQTATDQAATGQPPKRIRNVTLQGTEKCPTASGDEVVVCNKLEDPYRIPKALRDDKPVTAANQSWVNRAASMDQQGRVAGGLPDTCSPVGTGGQSGCSLQANQAYAAERRANARAATSVPGGE